MTKEEIFKELKELILAAKDEDKSKLLNSNYKERHLKLEQSIKQLNSSDMSWLNNEHDKWFKEHILPFIPHTPPRP